MILPLQQHPQFADALMGLGTWVDTVTLPDAAPVQVITRFGVRFVSRGPVWTGEPDPHALRGAHLRLINSNGGDAQALYDAGYRQLMTPATVAELPVFAQQSDMVTQMRSKWRNSWRRAQDSALAISAAPFHAAKHQWLLDADIAQQRQKRFRALPHAILRAYAHTAPKDVMVWTAMQRKSVVAGMIFLRHGAGATYHLGWANTAGRQCKAHHRLLIAAGCALAETGVRQIDLGTIDTHNQQGLARFKLGAGARARQLGGSWLRLF
ncbi:Acetyltransferase (GNAT) domain-containing protein [Yoonia tamlensis]|uniref:Acetyltransferase (GNAT) domain-containing protein n=1 Tax=Yoonia tamlensis TaxID=390270 RepID=A0A1I6G6J5_9RHOB|nr:GNAT family N-acetyltransferase [Yoonia tamlensis]SFR37799.1 Acetyltransferase (GNAT) domain-containing protein [Yoonia tamlensis]